MVEDVAHLDCRLIFVLFNAGLGADNVAVASVFRREPYLGPVHAVFNATQSQFLVVLNNVLSRLNSLAISLESLVGCTDLFHRNRECLAASDGTLVSFVYLYVLADCESLEVLPYQGHVSSIDLWLLVEAVVRLDRPWHCLCVGR